MLKRVFILIIAFCLILTASGCSAMLVKNYTVETDYEDETPVASENPGIAEIAINDYDQLMKEIGRMISKHEEQAKFKFSSYDAKDTDIESDVIRAREEARTASALAAYAVDFISLEPRRIVAYYEADITIAYRRTKEQIDSIEHLVGSYQMEDRLEKAIASASSELVFKMNTSETKESIDGVVSKIFYDNPLEVMTIPELEVIQYTGTDTQIIYEVLFNYGISALELLGNKKLSKEAFTELMDSLPEFSEDTSDAEMALVAFRKLIAETQYDPNAVIRIERYGEDSGLGNSIYGSLVEKLADSRGIALTYKEMCDELGIGCMVVTGRYDKGNHFWNIIKIDRSYYHVDASLAGILGVEDSFLRSDNEMWGGYIWVVEDYPECNGTMSYSSIVPIPEA